ncbi:MAG: DUF6090 family protein [Gracilimonas sp.]|nr:DUF6090 family protein [Gracilimonas sp.]
MLKFFRTIRKKLIEEDNLRKYLLYAIGEILLVVIGILIALQINNWNEYNKEREFERELLIQLQSEYQNNLGQLDEKITIRNNMITASTKLLDYIDHPDIRNIDSTYAFIGQTKINPTFDPILNDIISSGRIQLIQNAELRGKLTRFTSDIVQVTEEEERWQNYSHNFYTPTLMEYGRTIANRLWQNTLFSSFQLDGDIGSVPDIGDSNKNRDINDLLESTRFESSVTTCLSLALLANSQSMSLRTRIVDILEIIESELGNH